MSPIEIIFVIIGIALIIISCFLTREENAADSATFSEEVLEIQKKETEKMVQQVLADKTEEAIVKADDYLSRVSNEKIMAVNDFTDQILEKIDSNHKEVVFLYDMLNQKEDEIKQIVRQFESEKQEIRETVNDVARLSKQLNAKMKKAESASGAPKKTTTAEKEKKTEPKKKETVAEKNTADTVTVASENKTNGQMEFSDMLNQDSQRDEILRLYKQGKSVLEISKSLGMGQGEVKLIIGLYGL